MKKIFVFMLILFSLLICVQASAGASEYTPLASFTFDDEENYLNGGGGVTAVVTSGKPTFTILEPDENGVVNGVLHFDGNSALQIPVDLSGVTEFEISFEYYDDTDWQNDGTKDLFYVSGADNQFIGANVNTYTPFKVFYGNTSNEIYNLQAKSWHKIRLEYTFSGIYYTVNNGTRTLLSNTECDLKTILGESPAFYLATGSTADKDFVGYIDNLKIGISKKPKPTPIALNPFNNPGNDRPNLYNHMTLKAEGNDAPLERIVIPIFNSDTATVTLPDDAAIMSGFTPVEGGSTYSVTEAAGGNPRKLIGWYNIATNEYHSVLDGPVDVTVALKDENKKDILNVFYADWVAESYDFDVGSAATIETVDTNAFIDVHLFDYSDLVNVISMNVQQNNINSESWSSVDKSSEGYLVFSDWGTYQTEGSIGFPKDRGGANGYNQNANSGILNGNIISKLFDTSSMPGANSYIPGINHLGTGNYLYQYDKNTSMYHYESSINGAVFQQSEQRFYVLKDPTVYNGNNSFFPLNSVGQNLGKENGVTNFWFGLSTKVDFWLPDDSKTDGTSKNIIDGNAMIFEFTGDDDMWVLIDGEVVLDIGGIHDPVHGTIDFATGTVTVGSETKATSFKAGNHTMQIYYLERGGDRSNCDIQFNLLPRITNKLEVRKVLEGNKLEAGAFSFVLKEADGTVLQTVENDADGKIVFDAITYTRDDVNTEAGYSVFTYTISEINDGKPGVIYDTDTITATVTVTIAENGMLTASTVYSEATPTFNNTQIMGGLIVNKTVESDEEADKEKDFAFTVTLSDTSISGTYGDMTFTDGVATFTLKDGQSKTATGLPTGLSYTVTEEAVDGFTTTKTGDSGTISETDAATASFTNTRKTGDLTVKKTVASDAAADKTKDFAFTVTLSDTAINGTYGDMTFTDGVATFTLKDGQSKKATGLPTGITYTVTETTADGFDTQKTGDSGTISETETATASFTNTRKTGDLTVSKTVVSDAAADKTKEFSFMVTLNDTTINGTYGDMTFTNGVATFTLKDGQSKTATALPTGITYTVTETTADGFVTTKTGDVGTISEAKAATASFTNTRKTTGDLTVSKTVVSDAAADKTKDFAFTVTLSDTSISGTYGDMTFTNGVATFTLKDDQSKTATALPTGISYTVTEEAVDGFTTTMTGDAGTISEAEAATASFTNTQDVGGLKITKTVKNALDEHAEKEFTFTVTLSDAGTNGTYGNMTFVNGEATFTLKHNQSIEASGLPVGVEYVVEETPAAGFAADITGAKGTIEKDKTAETSFVNTYSAEATSVSFPVKKVLEVPDGLTGSDITDKFTFTLTAEDGVPMPDITSYTNPDADGGVVTFDKIPYNTPGIFTYTVTESGSVDGVTNDAVSSKTVIVTVEDNGDGTLTATASSTAKEPLTFTNAYDAEPITATIAATKVLEGRELAAGEFTFTLADANGDEIETVTNDGEGNVNFAELTFSKAGTYTYTITEAEGTLSGVKYDDHEVKVTVAITDDGKGQLKADVQYEGNTTFTNIYTAAGSFTIYAEKTVDGKVPTVDEVFSFILKDASGKTLQTVQNEKGVITFAPIAFTLDDAEKTYTYTIEEAEADGYQTDDSVYTLAVTLQDDGKGGMAVTGEVTKDGAKADRILFNNISLSGLTIGKTVVGSETEKAFAFEITLTDRNGKALTGSYPVTGGGVNSIENGGSILLKNGEEAMIADLPIGTKYTVEEKAVKGYTTTVDGAETVFARGEITKDENRADFVNTLKTVSFQVTKQWQGLEGDAIHLTLYANGEKMDPQPSLSRNENVYTYSDLPQYTEDGKGIVYAAKEKFMDGYMTMYLNKAPYVQESDMVYDGGKIVNRAVTEFAVKKVWEGLAEDEEAPQIELTLYCNGEAMDKATPKADKNGWYRYYNLPLFKGEVKAEYTVVETPLDGYTVTYGDDAEATSAKNGETITNRKIPKTGDNSHIALWTMTSAVSMAGLVILLKKRKKA